MNARPQIREKMIERKLLRWQRIARWHPFDRSCPPARARKNYWRLCAKYPHIMQRLGLSEISVYQ